MPTNPYESPGTEKSRFNARTGETARIFKWCILIALIVDAGALAYAIVPELLGYIGSDRYMWRSLAIAVIGIPVAIVLLILLAVALYFERRSRQSRDS
jgi:uncharacterized membrane protein